MKPFDAPSQYLNDLPEWVPDAARHYLLHTGAGIAIRELARLENCHASTISRQVQRFENRRDDPLIDRGLDRLADSDQVEIDNDLPDAETLEAEALRVLRRMCEVGAVLAVGDGMDRAVVVCDTPGGAPMRRAVLDVPVAEALALSGWIECIAPGRVARYRITQNGRQTLTRLMSRAEQNEMAETQGHFDATPRRTGTRRKLRYNLAESPLQGLARRRDRDGKPFLSPELVAVGERMREDFELSQLEPGVAQNWEAFMTAGVSVPTARDTVVISGPLAARARVEAALRDLGPGLGDMILRCCCHLEGLEAAEKRMGWSARSGKIVLRIALQRLRQHYAEQKDAPAPLIG